MCSRTKRLAPKWLNGQWLRDLPLEEFASRVQHWALNPDYMMKIAPLVQGRVETFSQIAPLAGFFFAGGVQPDAKLFEHKKLSNEQVRQLMQLILWKLDRISSASSFWRSPIATNNGQ